MLARADGMCNFGLILPVANSRSYFDCTMRRDAAAIGGEPRPDNCAVRRGSRLRAYGSFAVVHYPSMRSTAWMLVPSFVLRGCCRSYPFESVTLLASSLTYGNSRLWQGRGGGHVAVPKTMPRSRAIRAGNVRSAGTSPRTGQKNATIFSTDERSSYVRRYGQPRLVTSSTEVPRSKRLIARSQTRPCISRVELTARSNYFTKRSSGGFAATAHASA